MDIGRQTAEALSDRCLRWCVIYDRNLAVGQDFFMPKGELTPENAGVYRSMKKIRKRRIGNEKIFRRVF